MSRRRPTVGWALSCVLAAACGDLSVGDSEQATVVSGAGPTVKGIDVSSYQGVIDRAAARADGVEYAFIRAGDGATFTDPQFARNWSGAQAAGVLRGAYQFFRPAQDPIAQADRMLAVIAGAPGDLPPVIDVEDAGGLGPDVVEAAVRAWIDRVRPVLGREPTI